MMKNLSKLLKHYQICNMFTQMEPYSFVFDLIKNDGSDGKTLIFEQPYHVNINASAKDIDGAEIIFEYHAEELSAENTEVFLLSKKWNFRNSDKTLAIPDKLQKIFIIAGMFEVTIVCEKVCFE